MRMGGKMEGFWGVWVGVLLVIVAGLLRGVEGRASAQCVQLGQAADSLASLKEGNVGFSIGGKMMRPRYAEMLDAYPYANIRPHLPKQTFWHEDKKDIFGDMTCPKGYIINAYFGDNVAKEDKGIHNPVVDYCSKILHIEAYAVQQFGVTLRGWMYVEVYFDGLHSQKKWTGWDFWWETSLKRKELPDSYNNGDKADELEWIYVQVRDESFNSIGEFVSADEFGEGNGCGPFRDTELIYPSDYQIMPCSATGFREAKTGQALFLAKKRQYRLRYGDTWTDADIDKYLPKNGLKTGIRFLWRLNEYWCNRHEKFRIDVRAWSSKNEDTYYSSTREPGTWAECLEPNMASQAAGFGDPKKRTNQYKVYDDFSKAEVEMWKEMGPCRIMDKQSHWFKPLWFGAADIKTPGEPLNCEKKIYNGDTTPIPNHSTNWLNETVLPVKVREDYAAWSNAFLKEADVVPKHKTSGANAIYKRPNFKGIDIPVVKGCQVNPFVDSRIPGNAHGSEIVTFGGRCAGFLNKSASHKQYQACNLDGNASQYKNFEKDHSTWTSYKNYTVDITQGRKLACSVDCVELQDTDLGELRNIQLPNSGGNGTAGAEKFSKRPVSGKVLIEARRISRETTFWQVRKYHGNLCIFFTMFIIPVCLFITRYYKETFNHGRCASCPPWLWVHLFMCISVLTLFRSTFSAMRETIYAWGRQVEWNSEFHRGLGYAFVWVFGVMSCIGSLRPIPHIPRLAMCAMHSVVGFVLYLIALGLIMHSPSIPGSPSMDYCLEEGANNSNRSDPSEITHRVTIYAIAWLALDIIFHAFLTIFQVITDKRTGIERPGFGLPFIPFFPPNANRDYPGALVRKITLVVYVIVSFIMTIVTMADIFDNDLDSESGDHKFCKPWNVTTCNIRENPLGCTALQKQYFNIVSSRYNITWDD